MIYKPKGRRYYMAKFMWKGEIICKSTRATTAKDARSIEAKLRSELARGNWDILEPKPAPTLAEFLKKDFIPYCETKHAAKPATLRYYKTGAKSLADSALAQLKLDEITDQHSQQYAARNSTLSPSTVNCGLRTLRRAVYLASEWSKLDRRPKITLAKGERQRDRVPKHRASKGRRTICKRVKESGPLEYAFVSAHLIGERSTRRKMSGYATNREVRVYLEHHRFESLLLFQRDALLQFFKPVEDDVDLSWGAIASVDRLQHEETLAIGGDGVVRRSGRRQIVFSLKEHVRFASGKARMGSNVHGHHFVAVAIEDLTPIRIPKWLRAAFG